MRNGRIFLRPAQKVIDLIHAFTDWIYPPQCRVCGNDPDLCPFICSSCYRELSIFDQTPDSIIYHEDKPADEVKALFLFNETLQKMVHEIKYLDAPYLAEFFGREMGRCFLNRSISDVDAVIPVPLHAVRKRDRTYNQSAHLAKGISEEWDIPVRSKLVKRSRSTGTQTKLNKKERQENIKNAFKVNSKKNLPERICIVDDVFTTGATTMELARILKKAGVKKVNILCLATPVREKR